jgi:penicillin-binding protein 1A
MAKIKDSAQEEVKKRSGFLRIFFILCCIAVLALGAIIGILHDFSQELPPLSGLEEYKLLTGTKVFDKNNELVKLFASERRRRVSINEVPDTLIHALIAIEDENFYEHYGIDFKAVIRALLANISSGGIAQGASTITQQLARNMFLTPDQTIERKIKEMLLALRIERSFSKDQILEMYLNKTYFGGGNYGIESAANNFLGKTVSELTLPECALLARLPQAPSYLNPLVNYDEAVRRSKVVLTRMYELNYITEEQYKRAYNDTIIIKQKKVPKDPADYFLEYVRQYVEKKYGTAALYTGGLNVYTTLDLDLTNYADSVFNDHLRSLENRLGYDVKYDDFPSDTTDIETKYVQGGIFAIDPNTGYVPVMIGGRNFNHSKFNRMLQAKRQPGSAFKPFLYTAALANGYTPATMINDQPIVFIQGDSVFWKPTNYSDKFYGLTRLRTALKHSRNIPSIKMIYDIGPEEVVRYARLLGIECHLSPTLSLALGTSDVYPAEFITAYSPFANGGERIEPIYIKRIEDESGNILESHTPHRSRVLSRQLAYIMTSLMESVANGGTAAGIRSRGFTLPVAAKTGTTDNFQDAWCIGYTTQLVLGIWVGFDDNTTLGKGQAGAYVAVPPWPYIMNRTIYNNSPKDSTGKAIIDRKLYEFPRPDGIKTVTICDTTGLLAQPFCQNVYEEFFIEGTEPTILSDSLGYNFEPIGYQERTLDTLYIYLDKHIVTTTPYNQKETEKEE